MDDEKLNSSVVSLVAGLVIGCDYGAFANWAWGKEFYFKKGDIEAIRDAWNERHRDLLEIKEDGNVLRDLVHMTDLYNELVERKLRNLSSGVYDLGEYEQ